MQNRNTDTDIKKKTMDIKGGRGGGINWEIGTNIHTVLNIQPEYSLKGGYQLEAEAPNTLAH